MYQYFEISIRNIKIQQNAVSVSAEMTSLLILYKQLKKDYYEFIQYKQKSYQFVLNQEAVD